MSWQDITQNDFGWTGKLTLKQDGTAIDISSFTTLQFVFTNPNGTASVKTAVFDTNGSNGVLKYDIESGDITIAGTWQVQARIKKTGFELTSQKLSFLVDPDPS